MTSTIPILPAVINSVQASKWQKCPILIEIDEMRNLFETLGKFWIVQTNGIIPIGNEIIKQENFLDLYDFYITALKQGKVPAEDHFRAYFSSVFTTALDCLYGVKIREKECLIKVLKPVVQLQLHRFDYSLADGKFRSMVFGQDSIFWGIQFSYPHLYQDEKLNVYTVKDDMQFPNTALFKRLQQWVRSNTVATPFEVEGKRTNVPIRLGKKCFSWINMHPQFGIKGLHVVS